MPEPARRRRLRVGRLSLRVRLVLAAAVAVAIAVVLVAGGAYALTRHELYSQTDASLHADALSLGRRIEPGERLGFTLQVLDPVGNVIFGGQLPVTGADKAIAAGDRQSVYYDTTVNGGHFRVYTVGVVGGGAAQLAVPLDAVDHTLTHLATWLTLLGLGGIALASVLGLLAARAALVPVDRLTKDAERVAATMDLSSSIEVEGVDEIARLGQALNTLLATVDQSQAAQRRLVADASHELRTPLTSMRTNLELLARSSDIPEEERRAILSDLVAQAVELTALVNQLVDLEREPIGAETMVEFSFDDVVGAALSRARLHTPAVHFVAHLEPTTVVGQPGVIERAVANLLDNAGKWSPPGETVEVNLVGGTLSVRDHGPGIDPADAPHVFERFYRSARARSLPGSGLGLSIVRQAAERHGGQAWVIPAPGGGTIACLRVPVVGQPPAVVPVEPPGAGQPSPVPDAPTTRAPTPPAPAPGPPAPGAPVGPPPPVAGEPPPAAWSPPPAAEPAPGPNGPGWAPAERDSA
ncbi:MAG TPA: HAMP domain-containing sensor histidine kinase [Acidimicrobiales bacterium]|nr:HAMP domain-containing sensor histidine kinase [Acidimicrobiales bacterium]